jgi:hypothetical protein
MDDVVRRSRNERELLEICETALGWAAERDYAGWDPYDGLNSTRLSSLLGNWWSRLLVIQGVNRFPINLRPILGVPKERNPQGVALFAMSHLNLYEHLGDETRLHEAEALLNWLVDNSSPDYEDPCWGYNFGWQNGRKFYLPAYAPSIVVSTFCARAFLHHHRVTGDDRSLEVAAGTVEFIRSNINTRRVDGHTVFTYTSSDSFVVINANALAAALFAEVGEALGDDRLRARANELVSFVVSSQVDSGAWYYAVPRDDSHLSHDNFHTGFVLEALGRYLDVRGPAPEVASAYESGMAFYRTRLFEQDGAPKFQHDDPYPRDAHAAGQALRTFALDGRRPSVELAESLISWSVERLYDEEGFFYRYRGRLFADTTPYMRWSQAWMCYGITTYLRACRPRGAGGTAGSGSFPGSTGECTR